MSTPTRCEFGRRCLTIRNSDPVHHNPAWTFGVPLFKNYYTAWNGRDLTFGIARPNWKKASAP